MKSESKTESRSLAISAFEAPLPSKLVGHMYTLLGNRIKVCGQAMRVDRPLHFPLPATLPTSDDEGDDK